MFVGKYIINDKGIKGKYSNGTALYSAICVAIATAT